MEKIRVNGNLKEYMIVNEFDEELGVIRIDPSDFGIAQRIDDAQKKINEFLDQANSINTDGEDAVEKITSIDKGIKEEINNIFNYDVSSVVFGKTHCLSLQNGVSFVERVLDAIVPVVEVAIKKEMNASKNRVDKYTKQYHK